MALAEACLLPRAPAPPQWDRGKELLAKPMRSYDTAFWVLQIVLTSVALIPLSVARARAQGLSEQAGRACWSWAAVFWPGRGAVPRVHVCHPLPLSRCPCAADVALMLISTVLLGAVVCMGFLSQGFTLEYWWRMVVLSFVYGSLAAAAASVVAGCLVFVRSAHDEVRESAAALALKAGQLVSE